MSPLVVDRGDSASFTTSVKNFGTQAAANSFVVTFYASLDGTFNPSNGTTHILGTRTVAGLAGGATDTASVTFPFRPGTPVQMCRADCSTSSGALSSSAFVPEIHGAM